MADTLSSNPYEPIFTAQKALFRTGATRAREWRLDQLARMERMVSENEAELQDAVKSDFKTASEEYVFETQTAIGEVAFQRSQLDDWMKPVEAPVPKPLAATGHRAVIYRDPYGVALIIGPSNGPLTLLLRPAIRGACRWQHLYPDAERRPQAYVGDAAPANPSLFRRTGGRGGVWRPRGQYQPPPIAVRLAAPRWPRFSQRRRQSI
jgi:hypothetical protein